jgi:hypothetical protein
MEGNMVDTRWLRGAIWRMIIGGHEIGIWKPDVGVPNVD